MRVRKKGRRGEKEGERKKRERRKGKEHRGRQLPNSTKLFVSISTSQRVTSLGRQNKSST